MPYDVRRFAVFVGGLLCLVLPASAAEAQTRPHRFEIAAGTMYGFQDPERPLTAGWILSSGFALGRQSLVVEGAWHRDAYALERDVYALEYDEVFRQRVQSRYWMLMGGVRGRARQGRVAPYYQVLAGGFAARFRRDNEWPASIDTETANAECGTYFDGRPCLYVPYPEFDEERNAGFVVQPGMGLDVTVWRRFTVRLAADLPILAGGDYIVFRPKLSARVVVALGR